MNFDWLDRYAPQALAALRIVTALLFGEHGTQKLLQFPPMAFRGGAAPVDAGAAGGADAAAGAAGAGMGGMATLFLIAGLLETIGGLAILLGFLTRPIAFLLAGEAAVIFWWMHVGARGTIFPISNGGEAAVLFCFTFLYLVFAGAGAWSLDGMLARGRVRATT